MAVNMQLHHDVLPTLNSNSVEQLKLKQAPMDYVLWVCMKGIQPADSAGRRLKQYSTLFAAAKP
jgi:hypothetical protein